MLSLRSVLGIPSTRVPICLSAFASYGLPFFVCSFLLAVLALNPHTRPARVALWPVLVLLALRAVASLDTSLGMEPQGKFLRSFFVVFVFCHTARALDWTLTKGPLVRHLRSPNSSPSIILDAFDLTLNMRGHGWNWSNGLYIPRETRPQNPTAFVFYALISAAKHGLVCAVSSLTILSFAGAGRAADGFTVFDEALPFFLRHLRVGIMTALVGIVCYASLQMHYDLGTIAGIVFLRQDPVQWPPAFDAPWRATSLSDFWGRRWHQWHRRMFLFLGGYPLSRLLGRTGIVLGAFLASAVVHDMLVAEISKKSDAWRMLAAFGMMAPGVLAERAFYRLTGRKVGGVAGWVWTMTWLLMWNSLMLDALTRAGAISNGPSPSDAIVPLRGLPMWIDQVVGDFDTWLHSI